MHYDNRSTFLSILYTQTKVLIVENAILPLNRKKCIGNPWHRLLSSFMWPSPSLKIVESLQKLHYQRSFSEPSSFDLDQISYSVTSVYLWIPGSLPCSLIIFSKYSTLDFVSRRYVHSSSLTRKPYSFGEIFMLFTSYMLHFLLILIAGACKCLHHIYTIFLNYTKQHIRSKGGHFIQVGHITLDKNLKGENRI